MLVIDNISKTFNRNTVNEKPLFSHLSLTIQQGEFVTIIGGNGAGKSTLLNIIAGALAADEGQIILEGRDITSQSEHERARYMGRVFQDPLLGTSPNMTIEENLSLAFNRAQNTALKWGLSPKMRKLFCETLAPLQLGLEKRLTTKVKFLSGGQRQALTLLMATLTKPKLLL
ncbi:MAG: ATP-binding cassette domain-containing protein, partial [bacterium]